MARAYASPYSTTSAMLVPVAEIAERVGRLSAIRGEVAGPRRRHRSNRSRAVHATLAIEGNRLSPDQVTAILDGKRVLASPRGVQEVRNALLAYERFTGWMPEREQDLLEAHRILMAALVDAPGRYRAGGVGVMAGDLVVHMAPPAHRVPGLMADLLAWLGRAEDHPLITSSVFHYELEFIHPFADGNGRIGRLWQTLILSRWRALFADLPVETLVHAHQDAYYQAIAESIEAASATPFILFMLTMIRTALDELEDASQGEDGAARGDAIAEPLIEPPTERQTEQATEQVTEQVGRLLAALAGDVYSTKALMERLGLSHRPTFLYDYLRPALAAGWIEMTDPAHPRSPRQRYRLTPAGQGLLDAGVQEQRSV